MACEQGGGDYFQHPLKSARANLFDEASRSLRFLVPTVSVLAECHVKYWLRSAQPNGSRPQHASLQ